MADTQALIDTFSAELTLEQRRDLVAILALVVHDTTMRLLAEHAVSANDVRQVISEELWLARIDVATNEVTEVYVKYRDILERIVASADYYGRGWHWASVDWLLIGEAQGLLDGR